VIDVDNVVIGPDKKQFNNFKIWPFKINPQVEAENVEAVMANEPEIGTTSAGNYI
jgi:hypothetical protein